MAHQYQQSQPMMGGGGAFNTGPMGGGMPQDNMGGGMMGGGMAPGGAFGTGNAFGTNTNLGMGGAGMPGMGGMNQQAYNSQQFSTQHPGGQPNQFSAAPGGVGNIAMKATPPMQYMFFVAAASIVINAFFGGLVLFFNGSFLDSVNLTYIMLMGAAMAINDTPLLKNVNGIWNFKMRLKKYVSFLTRVTGKGVTFIFLGSALLSAMYINLEIALFRFTAVVLNLLVIIVGIVAIVIGVMKSMKLSLCRQHLEAVLDDVFPKYAKQFPPHVFHHQSGLTPTEFNLMTNESAGMKWDDADLKLIFDALVSNPNYRFTDGMQAGQQGQGDGVIKISLFDLKAWVHGGMVFL